MKKFISGASGRVFSLFRRREEEKREQSLTKERLPLVSCTLQCEFLVSFDCTDEQSRACKGGVSEKDEVL